MTMNADEVQSWKDRLHHSHIEWANAGLLPTAKNADSYKLLEFMDGYRGRFDDTMTGAVSHVEEFVGNLTFSIINTFIAQINARNPDPIVTPHGGTVAEDDAWRRAYLNEQIIRIHIEEGRFRREAGRALMSSVLSNMGFVRHGITPPREFEDDKGRALGRYKNQSPDLPWIQFHRPWQFRIDPIVNNFDMDGEPRWLAFHNLWFDYQIRRNPALIFRNDLRPTHFKDLRPLEEIRKSNTPHPDKSMPMYEEWLVYDIEERRVFGISPGSDQLIREEDDWPVEWGQLPGSILQLNEAIDSPFGVMMPEMFRDEQRLYNKIWTIIAAIVSRYRKVILTNEAAFKNNEEQLAMFEDPAALVEFIRCTGNPSEAAEVFEPLTLDGQLIGLLFQLKEQIREVLGVSAFDRGQRANVETAAEANNIAAGGQISTSRPRAKFEEFWANTIEVSNRALIQSTGGRELFIPLIGESNIAFLQESEEAQRFLRVRPEEIAGEFSYKVKLRSTLPNDPDIEFARNMALWNGLGGMKNNLVQQFFAVRRIVESAGEDPEKWIVAREAIKGIADAENQSGQIAEGAPPATQTGTQVAADLPGIPGMAA